MAESALKRPKVLSLFLKRPWITSPDFMSTFILRELILSVFSASWISTKSSGRLFFFLGGGGVGGWVGNLHRSFGPNNKIFS